jgi:hypothetical protein
MNTKTTPSILSTRAIVRVILGTTGLLLIPLLGMLVSDEVQWNSFDFLVMGTLIATTWLTFEALVSRHQKLESKLVVGMIMLAVFLLIWAELAVGVFGTPFAGS